MPTLGALLCLASAAAFGAMAAFGKLAYDEGATPRHPCSPPASCSPPRCSGCWLLATGGAPAPAGALAAGRGHGPCARGRRVRGAGRRLLRRARASRPRAALAARLHLSRDGHASRPSHWAATRRAAAPPPRWRSHPAASCWCSPAPPAARSTRSEPRSGCARRRCTAPTSSARTAWPRACAPLELTTLVCSGAGASLTLAGVLGGDLHPAGREPGGLWLACSGSRASRPWPRSSCSSPGCGAWAPAPPRSSPPWSRW